MRGVRSQRLPKRTVQVTARRCRVGSGGIPGNGIHALLAHPQSLALHTLPASPPSTRTRPAHSLVKPLLTTSLHSGHTLCFPVAAASSVSRSSQAPQHQCPHGVRSLHLTTPGRPGWYVPMQHGQSIAARSATTPTRRSSSARYLANRSLVEVGEYFSLAARASLRRAECEVRVRCAQFA